jgi:flagellar biosynthetic protein FliQ
MSADFAVELIRRAVLTSLLVSAPLLAVALLVGVVVSLIQAVTQIQEQTLTFIPKILAVGLVLLLTLPWVLTRLTQYLVETMNAIGHRVGA